MRAHEHCVLLPGLPQINLYQKALHLFLNLKMPISIAFCACIYIIVSYCTLCFFYNQEKERGIDPSKLMKKHNISQHQGENILSWMKNGKFWSLIVP